MKNENQDSEKLFSKVDVQKSVDEMSETEKLNRIISITEELEIRKKLYAEYDLLVTSLASNGFFRAFIGDLVVELKDNFAKGNTGFTTAAIKRFEVEIITKELAHKRELKALKKIL